jgi:hypothetical protein
MPTRRGLQPRAHQPGKLQFRGSCPAGRSERTFRITKVSCLPPEKSLVSGASFKSYSVRSTTAGSTDAALRAGSTLAISATSNSPASARPNATRSPGATPYNMDCSSREPAIASGKPMAMPARQTPRLSRTTIHSTSRRCAPSATRTPISAVRLLTLYARVPYRPVATSNTASTPKITPAARTAGPARTLFRTAAPVSSTARAAGPAQTREQHAALRAGNVPGRPPCGVPHAGRSSVNRASNYAGPHDCRSEDRQQEAARGKIPSYCSLPRMRYSPARVRLRSMYG